MVGDQADMVSPSGGCENRKTVYDVFNIKKTYTMRTNIDIDDALMKAALAAGPFKTKKEAVEAGLRLLGRQAHYREVLKWRGKLHWEGDDATSWAGALPTGSGVVTAPAVHEPRRESRRAGR
jgi:antitoxin ParD1/3/4